MVDDLRKIVEESFRMMGYEQVKLEQWTAIKAFVSGIDVFVALPTGFGKSLIYATFPLIYDNFKVVANKDLGRQRKWILTHQHCTTCLPHAKSRFSTMSTIPISRYRRAH